MPSRMGLKSARVAAAVVVVAVMCPAAKAQLLPGTGREYTQVTDDFEDTQWSYELNLPKSSKEQDERIRGPIGYSTNRKWTESKLRGTPDIVRRVATPPGGIVGSEGAMMMQTLNSGVPGQYSYEMMQDDLIANVSSRMGGAISVGRSPSFTVRVYLPPFDQWEDRTGATFGVRAGCITTVNEKKEKKGFFRKLFAKSKVSEPFWPGMFIQFNSKTDGKNTEDSALILVRSDTSGRDLPVRKIVEPGWWTFGMSFTPDGQVHYYASPGVDDLTPADHLASHFPYGYRVEHFKTFFFNVANMDNGQNWSTAWIIDDPKFYLNDGVQFTSNPQRTYRRR